MRQAFVAGALALCFAGSMISTVQAAPSVARTEAKQLVAVSGQAASPDVPEWTSHLITIQRSEAHGGRFSRFASSVLDRTSRIATELTRSALRFLGVPYVFGGTSSDGFDCSGYTQHVFAMLGVSIPRTADAQYYAGRPALGGPRPGDLVFFQTYLPGPSHVGIYLGNGEFVHASSHGVMVSHLSDSYWASRYLGAKRLLASK